MGKRKYRGKKAFSMQPSKNDNFSSSANRFLLNSLSNFSWLLLSVISIDFCLGLNSCSKAITYLPHQKTHRTGQVTIIFFDSKSRTPTCRKRPIRGCNWPCEIRDKLARSHNSISPSRALNNPNFEPSLFLASPYAGSRECHWKTA